MFLALRPSQQTIDRFIAESQALPLSYDPIGLARTDPASSHVDEEVVAIGRGEDAFERACAALARWEQFNLGWAELFLRNAGIEPGTVVAVLIRHLGFWSLNGCRVVYGVGDRQRGHQFGLAYGTLTNHAERGEELFEVFRHPASGDVMFRIRAVSRPRAVLARAGYPLTRYLQAKFRRDSAAAMRRAMERQ